jgi:hypothetical protein
MTNEGGDSMGQATVEIVGEGSGLGNVVDTGSVEDVNHRAPQFRVGRAGYKRGT